MLSVFPNSTLKVGARVSLSPETTWNLGGHNPLGISGTVISESIRVRWDNGRCNNYYREHYDLIAEGEPGYLSTE